MNNLLSIVGGNLPADDRSVRLFHGRGKKLPGFEHVTIDFYKPTLLITLFKEVSPALMDTILQSVVEIPAENILIQKRFLSRPVLEVFKGSIPDFAVAIEGALKFNLKFGEFQNIGFFLDMYLGRKWLESMSANKNILNLFSYTCSLSVAAMKGGASQVVNVDMSKAALSAGAENHRLNNISLKNVKFFPYDVMNSWGRIAKPGPYDIVIIDPPTNQGDSFKVERDYYKIVKRLWDMTTDDALIMACLNSPHLKSNFFIDLFSEYAPEFEFQKVIHSAFHSMEQDAEEGLKIVVFKRATRATLDIKTPKE
ncbi:MAG: class I SAM-dependent methyltransferase [Bacteriovorax sp.]|jgi:23S rRNA (cytosine1962-C5)-methyltransferase